MAAPLYEISADLNRILQLWDDLAEEGEIDAELQEWLEALHQEKVEERDRKLESYFCLVENLRALSTAQKTESKRLDELAKRNEAKADRLIARVKAYFEANQISSVNTVRFPIRLVSNGGKPPLILDDPDLDTIDSRFVVSMPKIDKEKVREALNAGEVLPFARLGERGSHLEWKGRVRTPGPKVNDLNGVRDDDPA